MKTIKIKADDLHGASKEYRNRRDASGRGASSFPEGEWNGHRISYNGRIWSDGLAIYNPVASDIWNASTHPDCLIGSDQ